MKKLSVDLVANVYGKGRASNCWTPSLCTQNSRVVRRVATTIGELTVDLEAKVEATSVHEISRVVRAVDAPKINWRSFAGDWTLGLSNFRLPKMYSSHSPTNH